MVTGGDGSGSLEDDVTSIHTTSFGKTIAQRRKKKGDELTPPETDDLLCVTVFGRLN